MKLLLDESLSFRHVASLAEAYPGSSHVDFMQLRGASDEAIWKHARAYGFALVSKDDDFRHLSLVHGAPPKVVWLRVGTASTVQLTEFLRARQVALRAFDDSATDSFLVLSWG